MFALIYFSKKINIKLDAYFKIFYKLSFKQIWQNMDNILSLLMIKLSKTGGPENGRL